MENILVATDFSTSALNALHYGIGLSKQYQMGVLLCHVYKAPLLVSEIPSEEGEADFWEQTNENLNKLSGEARHLLNIGENLDKLMLRENQLQNNSKLLREKNIGLAILGYHDRGILGDNFNIDGIQKLLAEAEIPIIWIKQGMKFREIKRWAVAIDFEVIPQNKTFSVFWRLLNLFNAETNIITIDRGRCDLKKTIALTQSLKIRGATFHFLPGDDLVIEAKNFCERNNIDMLCIFPHQHSLTDKMFYGNLTFSILKATETPLLCVQDNVAV